MRRFVLAAALLVGAGASVWANGRPPSTSTINFRRGNNQQIIAGMTFGALFSTDGGTTWQWTCEDNLQYSGVYDPHYVWTDTGTILETSFHGLRVSTDNDCTVDLSSIAQDVPPHSMSLVTQASNGDIYAAGTDAVDGNIYRSTDGGMTFPQKSAPGMPKDWWQALMVAPSDPTRVYLAGYRMQSTRQYLLFKSINSGVDWTPMTADFTQFNFVSSSVIDLAGIDPTNPDTLYARVTVVNQNIGDDIYRSTDAGLHWTKILSQNDSLRAFVVRANGDLVAGTQMLGAWVSHDQGANWTPLVNPPHLNCLAENAAGELWGCTLNFGSNQIPPDGYGIMKTTDLNTWTGVLRYQDITAPFSCNVGSIQEATCVATLWCGVRNQLGITANPTSCPDINADVPQVKPPAAPKGCCDVGDEGAPVWLGLALVVGLVLRRGRPLRERT